MRRLLLILFVLLTPSLASASGYYVWRNGCRYFVRNGCYYKVPCHNTCPPAAPTQTSGQIVASMIQKKAEWDFLERSIHAIFPNAGGPYYGSPEGNPYGTHSVQRGETAYGSSQGGSYTTTYATITPKPLDVMAMWNAAVKLNEQLNKTGNDATAGTQALLGQAMAGMNAALLTQAQMQREQAALKAMQPITPQEIQNQVTYHAESAATTTTKTDPDQKPADPELKAEAPNSGLEDFWVPLQVMVTNKCVTCHSASEPKGGFNMAGNVRDFSKEMWEKIIARTNHTDPAVRMPFQKPPLGYMEKGWCVAAWGTTNK